MKTYTCKTCNFKTAYLATIHVHVTLAHTDKDPIKAIENV